MNPSLVWLASYPKSGSTWIRVLLTNYWKDPPEAIDVNQLMPQMLTGSRALFEALSGLDASLLTDDEIDLFRPEACERLAEGATKPLILKVHDAFVTNREGQPLFPASVTLGVIYILRNPLDIVASYSFQMAEPLDRIIDWMEDDTFEIDPSTSRLAMGLRQRMLSWSSHVSSWVDCGLPLHIVRYEDLQRDPVSALLGITSFLGLDKDRARAEKAVKFSRFDALSAQEHQRGFWERSRHAPRFFRKGKVGSWATELNPRQVQRVVARHGDVMGRFGYETSGVFGA